MKLGVGKDDRNSYNESRWGTSERYSYAVSPAVSTPLVTAIQEVDDARNLVSWRVLHGRGLEHERLTLTTPAAVPPPPPHRVADCRLQLEYQRRRRQKDCRITSSKIEPSQNSFTTLDGGSNG